MPGAGDVHVIYSDDVVTILERKEMERETATETAAASKDEMIRMMMKLMMLQEHRGGTQYIQMYLFIWFTWWSENVKTDR